MENIEEIIYGIVIELDPISKPASDTFLKEF